MGARQPARETISIRKSSAAWQKMMCHCSAATLRDRLVAVVKAPRLVLFVLSILCSLGLLYSPVFGQSSTQHSTTAKKSTKRPVKRSSAKKKIKKRKRMSPRVRRVRQAFVASTSL